MKKHWNIEYVVAKLRSNYLSKKEGESPWLPYDCVKFLKQYLTKSDVFLETGSGNSTIWFSKLVKQITSIEHDSDWFNLVSQRIEERNIENIQYVLEDIEYIKHPEESNYVKKVSSFPDQSFDVILVDGKHRAQIALLSLKKIKKNGIIVIDNVERYLVINERLPEGIVTHSQIQEEWKLFNSQTTQYRKVVFSDGISSTIIYFLNGKED